MSFDTGIPNIRVVIREASNENLTVDVPNVSVNIQPGSQYNVNIIPNTVTTLRTGSFNTYADFAGIAATASYISGSGIIAGFATSASYALNAVSASYVSGSTTIGPGTVQSIALFDSTSTISSSIIYQSSNKIGIGTTSPTSSLHVSSNATIVTIEDFNSGQPTSIANIEYKYNSGSLGYVGYSGLATGSLDIWNYYSLGNIRFSTNNTERVRIDSTGRIGIGTISPSATLQVSGSQIIDGGLTVLESGSSMYPLTVGHSARSTTTYIRVNASSSIFRGYEIQTGGTRRWLMYADNNPDIGADAGSAFAIGAYTDAGTFIDNPIQIIRAAGSNMFLSRPLRVITGSNATPVINPAAGYGITFPTATNIGFVINSSEAMRIDSNRNVGIGTTSPSALLHVSASGTTNDLLVGTSSAPKLFVSASGNVGIGDSAPSDKLVINGRTRISGNNVLAFGDSSGGQAWIGITSALVGTLTFRTYDGSNFVERMRIVNTTGNVGINTAAPSASLHVSGSTIITGAVTASTALISGSGTQRLTVIGSGSAQPLFTVQGSQGELFSIVDSLSGSLFSVNDISGLPILEVFSDDTVLMGDYLAPSLNTTKRLTLNTGSNVIYSVPTASYDSIHIEYNIKSASVGRTGNFIGFNVGTASASLDTYTSSIGDTSTVIFQSFVSGANLVVTGSVPTNGWTYKAIIRAI